MSAFDSIFFNQQTECYQKASQRTSKSRCEVRRYRVLPPPGQSLWRPSPSTRTWGESSYGEVVRLLALVRQTSLRLILLAHLYLNTPRNRDWDRSTMRQQKVLHSVIIRNIVSY